MANYRLSIRVISILLSLTLLLSLAACKSSKKTGDTSSKNSSTANTVSSEIVSDSINSEVIDDLTSINDIDDALIGDIDVSDETDIDFVRPTTDGGISTGIKFSDEEDTLPDDDDVDTDEEDDFEMDLGDIEYVEDYEPIINPIGAATTNDKRTIQVDNSVEGIVYKDFNGLGANIYPTFTSYDSQIKTGTNPGYLEINTKRWNDFSAYYARSWFNIDWMITNEIEKNGESYEDYSDKIQENPDYNNYINGVYDFESDMMLACYDYWRMLEEAGTEIYLNFGWKVSARVSDWFSLTPEYSNSSAPADLKAYANAAAALFKHLKNEVGLTNTNTIAFYNEPNSVKRVDGDFATIGDKRVVWVNMVKAVYEKFKADPDLKDILIVSADCSDDVKYTENFVTPYLKEHIPELLDVWSLHYYYGGDPINTKAYPDNPYLSMAYNATYVSKFYNEHPIYFTEYYACSYDVKKDNARLSRYCWETYGFNGTECSYLIAMANNGISGGLSWGVVGGWVPSPTSMNLSNDECAAWYIPKDEESTNNTNYNYYERSLLNTYIKHHSNVHMVEWTGEDMHVSAFTSKDGKDFTLLVETKEETKAKQLSVDLNESLSGKTLNVFRMAYDITVKPDGNATVPALYDTVTNVKTKFNYELSEGYNFYIFTTYKPLKQIELTNAATDSVGVYNECAVDGTVKLNPSFVDNNSSVTNKTVKWEIKHYSMALQQIDGVDQPYQEKKKNLGKLEVSADGLLTYIPAADAKPGDVIAVRCSLTADSDRFASAVIVITE